MDMINSQTLYTGAFFLFILISGFWLARTAKPYNTFIFTIHKLVGLGIGIFLIRAVILTNQSSPLNSAQWMSIFITVLFFFITITAGGVLSILDAGNLKNMSQPTRTAVTLTHKFSPYVIIASTGVTLYLLI